MIGKVLVNIDSNRYGFVIGEDETFVTIMVFESSMFRMKKEDLFKKTQSWKLEK